MQASCLCRLIRAWIALEGKWDNARKLAKGVYMKPACISDQLMFNTVRLTANNGNCGTGFYFNFAVGDDRICPTIITNKHVVNDNPNEEMTFFVHLDDGNRSTTTSFKVSYKANWYFHPTQDLCFCFAAPVFNAVKQITGKEVFYVANDLSILATDEKLDSLKAVEEVSMVGYPIGLWDEHNNLPIFRHGYTASHPANDFNKPGIGLVDIACFPGSSGSPIYVLNEGAYIDKRGNMSIGSSRVIFLGILFAGPTYSADGIFEIENIPTQMTGYSQTRVMTNLGYYIRARELNVFQSMIEEIVK